MAAMEDTTTTTATAATTGHSILRFMTALPAQSLSRCYDQATCLALVRLCPPTARQWIHLLTWSEAILSEAQIASMLTKEGTKRKTSAFQLLDALNIIKADGKGFYRINPAFAQNLRIAILGGKEPCFATVAANADLVKVGRLDHHANQRWESMLHYMVGTRQSRRPSPGVIRLLTQSGYMSSDSTAITNRGFQFLLDDLDSQLWAILLNYISLAQSMQKDVVGILQFIFAMSSLTLGKCYTLSSLPHVGKDVLDDFRDLGLLYQNDTSWSSLFPTRLGTNLVSGTSRLSHRSGDVSKFVIVETNYRVYAYTSNSLQVAILNLFVTLKSRFSNLVIGVISRESVKKAFANGITASQIVGYLTSHAHPEMRRKKPLLPVTVIDQINLWELEKNRLKTAEGALYSDFKSQADYELVRNYANELSVVIWDSPSKRLFFVSKAGHEQVKSFVKRRIDSSK